MRNMFTTCPNCRLHLAVTPQDLRVGQGYVRCGRCDRVFNALVSLAEELDQDKQSGVVATGTTSVPALEERAPEAVAPSAPPPPPVPEPEPEPDLPPDAPEFTNTIPSFPEEWSKVTGINPQLAPEVAVEEQLATGTFETIVLEGEGYLQTEEHVDESDVEERLQDIALQIDTEAHNAQAEDDLDTVEVEEFESEVIEYAEEPAEEELAEADPAGADPAEEDHEFTLQDQPQTHWAWKAAAAVLALTLLAQVVHHHRQGLVATSWAEAPLGGLYRAFGSDLQPRWDLRAYDIRQLGGEAMSGVATTIVLRASVQNGAPRAQPPPMIRVTLQDRFGNALSTTDVAPQNYLKGDPPSRLRAEQRVDAELTLDDPNRQAVGFELDACLPDATGRIHCSNDP